MRKYRQKLLIELAQWNLAVGEDTECWAALIYAFAPSLIEVKVTVRVIK